MTPRPDRRPTLLDRALALARFDWRPAHRPPAARRLVVATVVSVAGSLAADALLVWIGTRVFPSTRGYVHFEFHDYARLTVVGVVVACLGWPVVARFTTQPRWVFLRLAVLVTLVLWLPDVYILAVGQPPRAVAVLMVMHLAIAVVTYTALVCLAPVRPTGRRRGAGAAPAPGHGSPTAVSETRQRGRRGGSRLAG